MIYTFYLKGRIPSKKNSLQRVKRGNRVYTMASDEYLAWEKQAVWELRSQANVQRLAKPLQKAKVDISVTFPCNRKADLTNRAEGLMDSLVKAGILLDDCWQCVSEVRVKACGLDKNNAGASIIVWED